MVPCIEIKKRYQIFLNLVYIQSSGLALVGSNNMLQVEILIKFMVLINYIQSMMTIS